jgi:outer membrane protein assembly factor BamE (lipoprotein component of BamABCDE complex)
LSLLWEVIKSLHAVALVAAVLVAAAIVGHTCLIDGLDGYLLATFYGDDTEYAPRYNDRAFKQVSPGETKAEVVNQLGVPLKEVWSYRRHAVSLPTVEFAGSHVTFVNPGSMPILRSISVGMPAAQVTALVGPPMEVVLVYSRAKHDRSYHVRVVELQNGRVTGKSAEFYVD